MRRCEIVICGAGISGLLLAAELSKHLAVIVLERNQRFACSTKFWLTSRQSLLANAELAPCVDSEWNEMEFIASTRAKFTAKGEYVLWDTRRLESHLIDLIASNGSTILYGTRFYSYSYTARGVVAFANNQSISASVLIDCMGFSSPIVRASGAVKILGYHHLLGKVLKLKKEITPIAADNVLLSDRISFFELFPRSDGNANAVIIAPAEAIRSVRTLGQDFKFIVEQSHYSDILEPLLGGDTLQGVVPVGVVKSMALNRILFFGEACQLHPASTGTCLTRLLLQYKSVAQAILEKVQLNALGSRDLGSVVRRMGRFAARFHQNMFLEQVRSTSSRGEAFVDLLHCLDQKSIDDFIFGAISPAHFLQADNLQRLLRRRNFVWVRPLVRTLFS